MNTTASKIGRNNYGYICIAILALTLIDPNARVQAMQVDESFDPANDRAAIVSAMRGWSSGIQELTGAESPTSPVVSDDDLSEIINSVPDMCKMHLDMEREKLDESRYDPEAWASHVAECQCCGPILSNIFAAHVQNVSKLPHTVVFFDYNSDEVTLDNRKRLTDFVRTHDNGEVRFLLIGRSSRTVPANHPVEYIRDHRTYNFQLSERRSLNVRDIISSEIIAPGANPNERFERIPMRNFGMADPQLVPEYADLYDFERYHWSSRHFRGNDEDGMYRMNQSVVVIAFSGEIDSHDHDNEPRQVKVRSQNVY